MTWHQEVAALHEEIRLALPSFRRQHGLGPFDLDARGSQFGLAVDGEALELRDRRQRAVLEWLDEPAHRRLGRSIEQYVEAGCGEPFPLVERHQILVQP